MKSNSKIAVTLAVVAVLSACTSTPRQIDSLERARAAISQVESSPRAGVAAANITSARKSLDAANRLAGSGGKVSDIDFEAENAITSVQIANEKIATAQAQEQVEKGTADRQALVLASRAREAQAGTQKASDAVDQAAVSTQRADMLEKELAVEKAKRAER